MKKILLALALLLSSTFSAASDREVKEMFVSLEPNVQLVITNAPCQMFKAPETVQLNFAYAVNIDTGDKVEGCFTHSGDIIQIELRDDANNFYSYKVHSNKFQQRPNL